MLVALEKIIQGDEQLLENLFQLYLHDMSYYAKFRISENGKFTFNPEILKAYFNQPHHYPYFIMHGGELAGFALIRRYPDDQDLLDMGQFFVLNSYKRTGVGKAAFQLCLEAHRGQWQVRILPENFAAKEFWRNAISEQTGGVYSTTQSNYQGNTMLFISFRV